MFSLGQGGQATSPFKSAPAMARPGMQQSTPYPPPPGSPWQQPQFGLPNANQAPYGHWYNNDVRMFGGTPSAPQSPQPPAAPTYGNITASIQPQQNVFSPQMTNMAANQAQAEADRYASLPEILKQFDRPGVSRGPGTISMALPQMAAVRSQGAESAAGIRAGDQLANRQQQLAGQQAQDAEGLGLAGMLRRLWGIDQSNQMNDFNLATGMLGRLF